MTVLKNVLAFTIRLHPAKTSTGSWRLNPATSDRRSVSSLDSADLFTVEIFLLAYAMRTAYGVEQECFPLAFRRDFATGNAVVFCLRSCGGSLLRWPPEPTSTSTNTHHVQRNRPSRRIWKLPSCTS